MTDGKCSRPKKYKTYFVWAVTLLVPFMLIFPYGRPSFLLLNISPSIPVGIYRRIWLTHVEVGDIVQFAIPEAAHGFVKERLGKVRSNWTILKPVAAISGDYVCVRDGALYINSRPIGPVVETDSAGRKVATWEGCRRLEEREFFVVSTVIERSFDSRVYGPIREEDLRGVYAPLWVSQSHVN